MAESVDILQRLLSGEEVTFAGQHYQLNAVRTPAAKQEHVPFLIAVNGRSALAHAARHADIIGLTMLGRTLEDGQRHQVRWEADRLDRTIAYTRKEAAERWNELELNALVQRVIITSDRHAAAEELVHHVSGLSPNDALTTPFLAIGTREEIADHLLYCRERWGISYYSVGTSRRLLPLLKNSGAGSFRMCDRARCIARDGAYA
jgi:alkanesulfonate monooxygenase SsuD/methylene tetrahydromethanopterin reductase-like flavin-dependent oxidoreductase (luciferase family)